MKVNPVYRFLLSSILLFIALLAIWYMVARFLSAPLGPITKEIIDLFFPGLILSLQSVPDTRAGIEFLTTLRQINALGQIDRFAIQVNPLIYGFGLPLFISLMVASKAKGLAWKLPLGAVILIIPQVWGVTFDFLLNLVTKVPRPVILELGIFGWKREFIALAYQLGTLILPIVTPVVLWVLMNRTFVYAVVFSGAIDEKESQFHRERTRDKEY
jgi:hypothetical protein